MPDQKISQLPDAGAPQAADQLAIARSAASLSLLWSNVTAAFDTAGAAAAAQAAAETYTDSSVSALSSVYQPLDSDLTAIAALTTTSFGRGLLTLADAAALRTAAALVIGTNVEAWDADLDDIAALTPTNDDIVQRKAGHWTNRTMAQLIADLAALGTTFQPLDSDLTAIAALTTTAFGRGLLTAANAAGLGITAADVGALGATAAAGGDLTGNYPNPTIGSAKVTVAKLAAAVTLDAIAAANATGADVSMNSHKITNLTNGSGAQDAAAFGQIPTALPPNGTAGGDLAGTYPNPTVAKLTETSGPTDLTIGTLTDGQFLKRSGTTIVSAASGSLDQYPNTFITVADEEIAANKEVLYSDFLELTASNVVELDVGAVIQLGTSPVPTGGLLKLYSATLTATGALDTGAHAIPPGYGNLYVVIIARTAAAAATEAFTLRVNGDSGSNYDQVGIQGSNAASSVSNTSAASAWSSAGVLEGNTGTAGYASIVIIDFPYYDNTAWFKNGTLRMATADGTTANSRIAQLTLGYRSFSAISQITLDSTSHMLAGSAITVYATG